MYGIIKYKKTGYTKWSVITNRNSYWVERRTDMKNRAVQMVDCITYNNTVIYSLGTLNWEIYGGISKDHITDEVIITEKQLAHIRERHSEAYIDMLNHIRDILDDPDYIIKDKRPNTGLVIKRTNSENENSLLVLKISAAGEQSRYKNSIITGWKITKKRLGNYLKNKEIIYIKE